MKDKNLPLDNIPQSLEELTKQANNIVQFLLENVFILDKTSLTKNCGWTQEGSLSIEELFSRLIERSSDNNRIPKAHHQLIHFLNYHF